MKKATEIKYPHAANLFQFCRRVLDHKFGGVRVIDQDIGQILGFDPADCSHWKRGKKNVRSIQAMKSIADHLGVDERLVIDVASGEMDDIEAFHEFNGYGAFAIDPKAYDTAKKEFYRRHATDWNKELEAEFREQSSINESQIDQVVAAIHQRISFAEAPLYLPEISAAYQDLKLTPIEAKDDEGLRASIDVARIEGKTQISYQQGAELKPFMRFRLAKAMAGHFMRDVRRDKESESEFSQHLHDVRSNLFAAKLLAPAGLIRLEIGQVNVTRDVVTQLAETFWVSKSLMNRRLKAVLQSSLTL